MARRIPRSDGKASAKKVLRKRNRKGKPIEVTDGLIRHMDDSDVLMSRLSGLYKMNGFRYGKYSHVSDVIGKCMRMVALSYLMDVKLQGEPLYDNTGVTFAIGDAIHDYVKAKAIRNNPEEVYGRWQCHCKKTEIQGTYKEAVIAKNKCNTCGELPTTYEELELKNKKYMISGHADLSHMIDASLYLSEIKSIKHESWETLEKPLADHILQIVFYWWLAREMGYSLHQQVSVFYVTKSYVFGKSPFKEFTLDPVKYLSRLDDYKEDAKALKKARAGGKLPLRICPKPMSPRAKKCEMCSICFGWNDE